VSGYIFSSEVSILLQYMLEMNLSLDHMHIARCGIAYCCFIHPSLFLIPTVALFMSSSNRCIASHLPFVICPWFHVRPEKKSRVQVRGLCGTSHQSIPFSPSSFIICVQNFCYLCQIVKVVCHVTAIFFSCCKRHIHWIKW
jgi:hypothetical protein